MQSTCQKVYEALGRNQGVTPGLLARETELHPQVVETALEFLISIGVAWSKWSESQVGYFQADGLLEEFPMSPRQTQYMRAILQSEGK